MILKIICVFVALFVALLSLKRIYEDFSFENTGWSDGGARAGTGRWAEDPGRTNPRSRSLPDRVVLCHAHELVGVRDMHKSTSGVG